MKKLWQEIKTIAVVGLSDKPTRPSYMVAKYMQSAGFKIIPVNPQCQEILGEVCYPDLLNIPEKVDMVDIFRKSEDCLPIAKDAVQIGAQVFWMQMGVINHEAAEYATLHGLEVIMDQCLMIEHMHQS
jgi:predicted CoA-binding protein